MQHLGRIVSLMIKINNTCTYVIIYGMMDTIIHATALQAIYSPGPADTTMPTEADVDSTCRPFTDCAFRIAAVQNAAPRSKNMLPRMEKREAKKKVHVCLRIPLVVAFLRLKKDVTGGSETHAIKDIPTKMKPKSSMYEAVFENEPR